MLFLVLIACQPEIVEETPSVSMVVSLRWTAEPDGITWEQAEAGLAWSLTNLGALPPPEGWINIIESDGDTVIFELYLEQIGFDAQAKEALVSAITPIQSSDERAVLGSVDVGRFLMRTLYAPWRYYSITGACADFADWSALSMGADVEQYGVTVSLLTEDDRLVTLNAGPWRDVSDVGFATRSGVGVLRDSSVSEEVEVIDLMANGQQRYAVFDAEGSLAPAADPDVIAAGQPGKCMWCHEGALMTGTPANPTTRPYLSYPEWMTRMSEMQTLQDDHRQGLETAADFVERQAHSDGELLVREFLRPKLARMTVEWGISVEELESLLAKYDVEYTFDDEYPSRGRILDRTVLDVIYAAELADPGFEALEILPDDREAPEEFAGLEGEAEFAELPGCWRP